jgi:hypothetical protein
MIHPRYPRLSSVIKNALVRQALPTGNGFGGSSLKIVPEQELVLPKVSSSVLLVDPTPSTCIEESSPLVIEVSKIVVLAFWFWCLIGADFCFNSISAIVGSSTQDV